MNPTRIISLLSQAATLLLLIFFNIIQKKDPAFTESFHPIIIFYCFLKVTLLFLAFATIVPSSESGAESFITSLLNLSSLIP